MRVLLVAFVLAVAVGMLLAWVPVDLVAGFLAGLIG